MKGRWMRWALGASVILLTNNPVALAKVDPAHLIVPGKAIGPVALGATLAEVKARIGEPNDVRKLDPEHALMQWREQSLVVGLEQDRVVLVGTNSNLYATSTGLKVGVPGSKALHLFPGLTAPKVRGLFGLTDDSMGINFLHHPADENGVPLQQHTLAEDWVIDEINVFKSADGVVVDRKEP